ncbi:MAG: hypothetical protein AAFP10_03465 [Pseudomonadota bacterium]
MAYQNYAICTEHTTDSCIVVKEHKSQFVLCNDSRLKVEKIKVDGCLSDGKTGQHKQCDWLFVIPKTKQCKKMTALYIELKGSRIDKAEKQLQETVERTKDRFAAAKRQCFIVTTRVPCHDTVVQKMKKRFSRQGLSLQIKTGTLKYSIQGGL